ncbi:MAG: HAMP domain-containing sensor histidine kinase [bacterium]
MEKFLRKLNKFFVCFDSEGELTHNTDSFGDTVLHQKFIDQIIEKIRIFYIENRQALKRLKKIQKIDIPFEINHLTIKLNFLVVPLKSRICFILCNDYHLKYEILKVNIINAISHELKTPLTIIKGYVQYIMKAQIKQESLRDIMQIMLSEIYRLEERIYELVEVSKFYSDSVSIKKDSFSVSKLIDMVVSRSMPKIESKKIDLKVEIEGDDFEIVADFEKIKYMLSELLENAIKYGRDRIVIKTCKVRKGFLLSVIDNGIGMPKEIVDNVVDLFIRTDNELSRRIYGLGVGLFLVKKIVEYHKGEIQIYSEPNKGTEFKVFIPYS